MIVRSNVKPIKPNSTQAPILGKLDEYINIKYGWFMLTGSTTQIHEVPQRGDSKRQGRH